MKPISLSLSGLQSYRSRQDVDFVALGELGLFGIFGPTGSGKSTILDAITLALYGSVERAPNRIRGIMNNYENQLSVVFSFEIGAGEGRTRFRVERSYKRGSDGAIASNRCRLIEVPVAASGFVGAETPVADKEREVNAAILGIIGLSLEDFSRAVVLPQGKFADFLTLRGADRTRMLQRLFALEEYGQALIDRAKAQQDECRSRLSAVEGEKAGLGDCSEAAMATATEGAQRLEADLTVRQATFEGAQRQHETLRALRAWLGELQTLEEKAKGHRAKSAAMEAVGTTLSIARRCEPIGGIIVEARALDASLVASQTELSRLVGILSASRSELANAAQHLVESARRRDSEEPELTASRLRFEQAARVYGDLQALTAELNSLNAQASAATGDLRRLDDALAVQSVLLRSLNDEVGETGAEMRAKSVDPLRRRQILDAQLLAVSAAATHTQRACAEQDEMAADSAWTEALAEHARSLKAVEAAKGLLDQAVARQSAHTMARPSDERELRAAASELDRLTKVVADLARLDSEMSESERALADRRTQAEEASAQEAAVALQLSEARAHVAQLEAASVVGREELEAALRNQALSRLAAQLTPGEPCPLCGSLEHPEPTLAPHATSQESLEVLEVRSRLASVSTELAEARESLAGIDRESAFGQARTAELAGRVGEGEARLSSLLSEREACSARLPLAWVLADRDDIERLLTHEGARLVQMTVRADEWQKSLELAAVEVAAHGVRLSEAKQALAGAQAREVAAKQARTVASDRRDSAQTADAAASAALTSARGDVAEEDIGPLAARIAEWDDRCRALRVREADCRTRLGALEADMGVAREARAGRDRDAAVLTTKVSERQDSLNQKRGELEALTGGCPIEETIASIDLTVALLRQGASKAQENCDAKADVVKGLEASELGARTANALAEARSQDCHARLGTAMASAGFREVAEVEAGLLGAGRVAELGLALQTYEREGDALEAERVRLASLVGGRGLAEAEWGECCGALAEAQEGLATCGENLAVARSTLSSLAHDRQRWLDLEAERASLGAVSDRLTRLAYLLRGNAFVQFLAAEHMQNIVADASARLADFTGRRYNLEIGDDSEFLVRDNMNGGTLRPAGTLSGGETFLTSLCLALALSSQIQLRGERPLEFFFLDEGFGTLDEALLDTVVSALERLHMNRITIGIISHVPELRLRLARRLVVVPATGGAGSRLQLELG